MRSDASQFYVSRGDNDNVQSLDNWVAPLLPFETVLLTGSGGAYVQSFDDLSSSPQAGSPLPTGWTFTANDIVFNNATTDRFPATRHNDAGVYDAGDLVAAFQMGNYVDTASPVNGIPEPTTAVLLLIGCCVLRGHRRRAS
jgi:hypothetical protein